MRAERGQGMKFRLNIEHKIMIPFLTIGILTILCFGTIMTWNGYVQKMERERAAAASSLRALELDAGLSGSGTLLLQKYRLIQNDSLYLFDADGVLLLGTQPPDPDDILLETGLPAFGWRACYALDRTAFWNSLIEEQKYMILATIALLIVIVQVSLFVSYNISEPLRQLSEACRVVAVGEQPVRRSPQVDEYAERSDEIGQLANAFQRMLADIASHTDEILRMKLLNETIVESLPLGIVACSPEKEIICINSKAVEMLDQTGYLCGGQTLRQIVDGIIVSPKVLHDPIRLQNADGRAVDYEIGVWRLRTADEGEGGTLCTLDEITYKKRMEEKLTEGEKLAYTGQLAAMLAHEIRNPLAGIRAGIQVISRRLESGRDRMLSTSILGEVDRVNRLIEDLLHLSRKRESQKVLINLPRSPRTTASGSPPGCRGTRRSMPTNRKSGRCLSISSTTASNRSTAGGQSRWKPAGKGIRPSSLSRTPGMGWTKPPCGAYMLRWRRGVPAAGWGFRSSPACSPRITALSRSTPLPDRAPASPSSSTREGHHEI